jgi:peptide chain release factor subunit 1
LADEKVTHFHSCQMATTDSVKQHRLRKLIARLSGKEGKGKEFLSLYLPGGTSITETIRFLKEKSGFLDANSRDIEERVQEVIKTAIQRLKLHTEISGNGLAVFAGVYGENGSDGSVMNVEEMVPPEPVGAFLFGVEGHFLLEPLREMVRGQRVVGLLALDSKEASFGIFQNERLDVTETITSGIAGKSGKGGSSQRRYERERDMAVTYFFHRVGEHAAKAFLENRAVSVLIVGGPGLTKEDFLKGDFLHYELRTVLLDVVDTQSAGAEALSEMLDKSSEMLKNMCGPEEKRIVDRLLKHMGQDDGLAIAGLDSVLEALENGEVEVVLVTDSIDMIDVVAVCRRCGLPRSKIVAKEHKVGEVQSMASSPCERCKSIDYEVEQKDIVDVLEDLASQTNAVVEVISTVSEEKAKLTSFGGFAAILRYRPGTLQ